ncbi:serine-rich adhesin for platelets-like [Littorina saxatilis]|uniref:serine-rich adhesin for platelets-like n=1 Tax=Littorina saxatilis TaxID=31220 RepID=UPI0038B6278A
MDSASEDILLKQVVKIENVMDDWQYGQQYNSVASSDVADPRKDPILGTTATKEEPGTSETEKDPASIIAAVKTEPGTSDKDPGSIIAAVKTEPDIDTLLYPGESPDRTVSYSHAKEDVRVKCEEMAEENLGHNGLLAKDRIGNCDDSSQSKKSIKLESDETEILPFCKPESSVSASGAESKQQDAEISQVCKQESSEFNPAAYSKELVNNNNTTLSPPHTVACSEYSLLTAKPVPVAEPTSLMPVVGSQISLVSLLKNNAQVARDRPVTTTTGGQLREPQTVWTVKAKTACSTTSPKEPASVKSSSSTTAKTSKQKQPVMLLVDSQYGLCVPDQRLADKLCQKGQDPVSANKLITADPIRVSYVTGKAAVNNSTPGKKDSVVMLKAGASEEKKTKGSPAPAMETFLIQMPGQSNEHSAPSSNHPPRTVQTSQTNFLVQMPGQSVKHNVSSNQQPESSLQISQQQLLKISEAISAVRKIQQKPDHAETAYEKFFVNFSTGTTVQGIEETAVAKHKPSILQHPALSGSELLLKTQHSSSGTSKDSGKSLLKSAGIEKGLSKSGHISSTPQRSTSTPQGNWTSRQKVTSPISSRSSFVTTDGAANTKSKNTGVNSQQVSSRGSAQSDKVQAAKQTFKACRECFSFIPVSQMQKHVTACHPQGVSIVYKCPSCPAVFKSLSAQEQHTKQHTMQSMQENIEIVDNCDGESNVTDDWSYESSQEDESIQDDDNNAEDNASVDEKAEENPQDVDVSAAEEENLAEEEQFFCCVCGRGYPSSERWVRHRLSKHPQVRHLDCEICGEFYKISGTGPESGKRRKLSGSFCTICQTDVNENLILHIQREHEQSEPDSSDTDTTNSDGEIDNDSEYGDESAQKTDRNKADNAARKNSNDKETAGSLQESKSQLEGEHEHDKSKPSVSVREDSTASNVKPASCSENKSLAVTTSNTQNKQAELSQKRAKDNTQRQTDTTGNSSGDAARQAKARVNAAVYRCPLCGSAFPQTTDLLQHMGTHAGYGEYIQRCATAYAE